MANTTRGNLAAARIYEVDDKGQETGGGVSVSCMFNPFEYTVTKTNSFKEKPSNDADAPQSEFSASGPQTLKLSLTFDAFEAGQDVSQETRKLWKLMQVKTNRQSGQGKKVPPPQVAFEWGVFKFVAYITNMSQRFTLFGSDGTPRRAKVEVTFTQYRDLEDYGPQNPTSGGGPHERLWRVTTGDRLDTIAAQVYGDAAKWRQIAAHNRIVNPLAVRPGQQLRIPMD